MKTLIVSGAQPRDGRTRSPIELFWTAENLELLQIRANHEENIAEEKSCKDIAEAGHHQKSIRKVQIILPIK